VASPICGLECQIGKGKATAEKKGRRTTANMSLTLNHLTIAFGTFHKNVMLPDYYSKAVVRWATPSLVPVVKISPAPRKCQHQRRARCHGASSA
jgi:hypothetical protein